MTDLIADAARRAEQWRSALAARDDAIREARTAGASLRQLAEATGLSHQTIADITRRP